VAGQTKQIGHPWWVTIRHDEFAVVQAATMPQMENNPGQRRGRVIGPFATRDVAQKMSDARYSRTLKAKTAGGV
jgi:hypothetical protein